jgi:glycosyltransferase involved in cell wall biosynthesis
MLGDLVALLRADLGPSLSIIVVDNASRVPVPVTSGAEIVRLGDRVTIGAARNAGLLLVRTPLVAFIDADDMPIPGTLRDLCARVSGETVAAAAGVLAGHPRTATQIPLPLPPLNALRLQRRRMLFAVYALARHAFPIVGPCVLATNAVRAAGGFSDADFCEDWALAAALAFRGRIALCSQPGLLCQFHEGSEITRVGTPINIARAVGTLHARWYRDPAIPGIVKALLPLLAMRRLFTAGKRAVRGEIAHDDVLAKLGRHPLSRASATPTFPSIGE